MTNLVIDEIKKSKYYKPEDLDVRNRFFNFFSEEEREKLKIVKVYKQKDVNFFNTKYALTNILHAKDILKFYDFDLLTEIKRDTIKLVFDGDKVKYQKYFVYEENKDLLYYYNNLINSLFNVVGKFKINLKNTVFENTNIYNLVTVNLVELIIKLEESIDSWFIQGMVPYYYDAETNFFIKTSEVFILQNIILIETLLNTCLKLIKIEIKKRKNNLNFEVKELKNKLLDSKIALTSSINYLNSVYNNLNEVEFPDNIQNYLNNEKEKLNILIKT